MNSTPSVSRNFAGWPAAAESGSAVALRARRFFLLNMMLGAAVLIAAAVTVASGVGAVHAVSGPRTGHFTLAGQQFSRPYLNLAAAPLLALAVVGLLTLVRGLAAASAEARSSRRFIHAMGARRPRRDGDVLVFEEATVQAFCAGLWRPQIYISAGALAALSGPQLEAVLAHERHHRRRRDPLRIALGRVLSAALFFLPVVTQLHRRYRAMAELAADDTAIATAPGGSQALASALLEFAGSGQPQSAVGIAPERVDQLMGRAPSWPLPAAVVAAALAAASLIAASAWQLTQLASVRASFSLPLLSAKPCVVVLALIPGAVSALAVAHLRRRP
jgi:Zn-dependent protease with chaperone function